MNIDRRWTMVNTCRLAVSAIFIVSGMTKLVDPVGTQLKVEEYANALGVEHYVALVSPLLVAVTLSLTEFCTGISLFFGIRRRVTTSLSLLLALSFSLLTLWSAATGAVPECGCFGDAWKLTPWQTFGKNVVLTCMAAVVWWRGNLLSRFISESVQWIVSIYSFLFGFFVALTGIYGEPILDFRPFHVGQHIPTAMQWPDDVDRLPAIPDFDLDEAILTDTARTFLLIAPHLETADDSNLNAINALYDYARSRHERFVCLTASDDAAISRWQDLTGAEYPFLFMDDSVLRTVARSNPALMLLHDGWIEGKWSHSSLPEPAAFDSMSMADNRRSMLAGTLRLALWYIIPLLLLTLLDRTIFAMRWWRRRHQRLST